MQKQLNENFYLTIQRELRNLALKSSKLTYGELLGEFIVLQEKVYWSNWGLQGNLTKKGLIEYFEILLQKLNKESRGFKFLKVYLFDKQVKDSRKKMQKRYMIDFKE